jgi:hypothetical protein
LKTVCRSIRLCLKTHKRDPFHGPGTHYKGKTAHASDVNGHQHLTQTVFHAAQPDQPDYAQFFSIAITIAFEILFRINQTLILKLQSDFDFYFLTGP